MFVYAGIDEAGYGPLLGPLTVGRSVFCVDDHAEPDPPKLWWLLHRSVARTLSGRKGRIAVNDSKKLLTAAAGLKHLEAGCLAFAALGGCEPGCLQSWLAEVGSGCDGELDGLPWYAAEDARPWDDLPSANTAGELAIARAMLRKDARARGVTVPDMAVHVVFEDRFNHMLGQTRSKAATSFTFVARHLQHVWESYGKHGPYVAVDRQGGRSHYREPLAMNFPGAALAVLEETPERSAYRLTQGPRSMIVTFEVSAEQRHMPTALASMACKYTRELLMARFNGYFTRRVPDLAPTAGYSVDGRRFLDELTPHLPRLGLRAEQLARLA